MRLYNNILILISIQCLFGITAVFADDPNSHIALDAVVVTAEKTAGHYETGDVDTEQTPADYTVIEREEFEGKMENLAQVIEKQVGVQIRQTGGLGSYSTVSLRGSSSDQVMVYLDGILLNDASGGGVDLSNISLSDVEYIEIYRGTTPVNFSTASIGGVVNIKTMRVEDGLQAGMGSGYGSFNTKDVSGFLNYKLENISYLMSADCLNSDNNYKFTNNNGTPLNPDDDERQERNNARFNQYNLLSKFGFDLSGNKNIAFINQYFSKRQHLPNWNNSEMTDARFDTKRNISTLKFIADDIGPLHLNTATGITYTYKDEEYRDVHSDIGLGNQHSEYITERYGGEFYCEWLDDSNTAILIINADKEMYEQKDMLSGIDPGDSSRQTLRIGIQDSIIFFEDMVVATPALRYTLVADRLKGGQDVYGEIEGDISQHMAHFNPQIGIKVQPFNWLAVKSNLDRYDRLPSFFELFGDRGFSIGNYELEKETGVNLDIGIEINKEIDEIDIDRFFIGATYYQSTIDDLITRVYDARGIGKSVNISGADIQGIELGCQIEAFKHLMLTGNATIQDTINHSKIKGFDSKILPGQFQEKYMLKADLHYNQCMMSAEYIVNKEMYYDTANLLEAEDQKDINVGLSMLFNNWLISLEARNITDNHYEDFNGYPMPGIAYYLRAKCDF